MHMIRNFFLPMLTILVPFLGLGSCKLATTTYKEDYDRSSPLYAKAVTGVGRSNQKLFATTSEGNLWERNIQTGAWTKLNEKLPKAYNKAVYMLESPVNGSGRNAQLVLVNENTNTVGVCQLIYYQSNIIETDAPYVNQKVQGLVRNSYANSNAYLATVDASSSKAGAPLYLHVYDFMSSGKEVPLPGKDKMNPTKDDQILGCLQDRAVFLVRINRDGKSTYELRGAGLNEPVAVNCPAGKEIKLLNCANVQGKCNPVVIMSNNDIHPINPQTGKVDTSVCIKGLGDRLNANGMGRLGKTYVLTTNKGYYEIAENGIRQPSEETTDTLSYYKQNGLNRAHILGIHELSENNIYLNTYNRGLWVRDPQTKKWKGV